MMPRDTSGASWSLVIPDSASSRRAASCGAPVYELADWGRGRELHPILAQLGAWGCAVVRSARGRPERRRVDGGARSDVGWEGRRGSSRNVPAPAREGVAGSLTSTAPRADPVCVRRSRRSERRRAGRGVAARGAPISPGAALARRGVFPLGASGGQRGAAALAHGHHGCSGRSGSDCAPHGFWSRTARRRTTSGTWSQVRSIDRTRHAR